MTETLEITGIGAAGDGIARLADGSTCFVPLARPGETVRATVQGNRANLEAVRTHAARALVMLGTAEARAVLLEYSTARDAMIKRACEQAIKGNVRDAR